MRRSPFCASVQHRRVGLERHAALAEPVQEHRRDQRPLLGTGGLLLDERRQRHRLLGVRPTRGRLRRHLGGEDLAKPPDHGAEDALRRRCQSGRSRCRGRGSPRRRPAADPPRPGRRGPPAAPGRFPRAQAGRAEHEKPPDGPCDPSGMVIACSASGGPVRRSSSSTRRRAARQCGTRPSARRGRGR